MAWVRIDDNFSEHPKWGNADPFQVQWFIYALCYCNRNLTDGFIPFRVAYRLISNDDYYPGEAPASEQVCSRLVNWGVLTVDEERMGYHIVGYLEYQPSKAEVLKEREATAKRVGRWRNAHRNGVTNGVINGPVTVAPNPNPNPNTKKKERTEHVRADAQTPPEFLTFWDRYPRKEAKQDALKAWRQVQPKNGTVEAILTNVDARRGSFDWTKDGGRFVPLPATFLRQRRWEDETVNLSPSALSRHEPSAESLRLAREHYRKVGGCQHDPTHTYGECIRFLAESWQ